MLWRHIFHPRAYRAKVCERNYAAKNPKLKHPSLTVVSGRRLGADDLQPAMKYTDIAATPQEFLEKLEAAEWSPPRPGDAPNVAAHIKFN